MKESKIISINPGVKTLGELHNPSTVSGIGCVTDIINAQATEVPSWFDFFYGQHDKTRPALATLLIRVLSAASTLWCASFLPIGAFSLTMIFMAVFVLSGLFSRISSIANLALATMLLINASGSSSFHVILTASGISIALGTLLIITGSGRYSLDDVLAKSIKK